MKTALQHRPAADSDDAAGHGAVAEAPKKRRLDRAQRSQMIVEGAMHFFAQNGIDATTRELADAIGVSSGLIFRCFGTKQALVEKVFDHAFTQRWSRSWAVMMADKSRPLRDRLCEFYGEYYRTIDEDDWIRIMLLASLARHHGLLRKHQRLVENMLGQIMRELRIERGLGVEEPTSARDRELAWQLHSSFLYALVRRHILRLAVWDDREAFVAAMVDGFLDGALRPEADRAPQRGT